MKFLLNYELNDDDINRIVKANDEAIIKNIEMNEKNVISVIEYFREIGVTAQAIKELFLHQIGMFFRTKEEIKTVFDEYEIDSVTKSLNYDVNTVDLIEFN